MVRVKRGVTHHARHKKILALTKGHSGGRHRLYKTAKESMVHALAYQYRDRWAKKRDFRRLWIQRINAGARQLGMSYSRLINMLKTGDIEVNRKMLAELALNDPATFESLVKLAAEPAAETAAPAGAVALATTAEASTRPEPAMDSGEAPEAEAAPAAPARRRRTAPSA